MPGSIRLFVPDDLGTGRTVVLAAAQAHYLGRVMRRGPGDAVLLFNGRDGEWAARVEAAGRVAVERLVRAQPAADGPWLLLPPLRREASEWAVEKATELGAGRIALVVTARTNPARPGLARLRAIATEAAEQCERLDMPAIDEARPLGEALAAWPAGRTLVVAVERGDAAPIVPPPGPVALLVGPEGGFAAGELDVLRRTPFVVPASLGPRILRAETAAIAGLVLLQARTTA